MTAFLKLLLSKFTPGWEMSLTISEGFYESSQNKGLVIRVRIVNEVHRMGEFSITKELIEQAAEPLLDQILDKEIQKIFDQLKS